MEQGILYVETWPSSPERTDEFHRWYDEVHLAEVVRIPGILAARRYDPVRPDGGYVAIYELECDDLRDVVRAINRTIAEGGFEMSDALQTDPPPVMRLLTLRTTETAPDS